MVACYGRNLLFALCKLEIARHHCCHGHRGSRGLEADLGTAPGMEQVPSPQCPVRNEPPRAPGSLRTNPPLPWGQETAVIIILSITVPPKQEPERAAFPTQLPRSQLKRLHGTEAQHSQVSTWAAQKQPALTSTPTFWDLLYADTKVTTQHCGCIKGRCGV